MHTSRPTLPFALAGALGFLLWLVASIISGEREPWDASLYWAAAYPLALLACGVLGYYFPQRPWRYALVLFEAQFVAMCIRNGELGNLWPLGMALLAILALPGMLAAQVAARLSVQHSGDSEA